MIEPAGLGSVGAMAAIHAAAFPPNARWGATSFALELVLPGVFGLIDRRGAFLLGRIAADEAEVLTLAVVPALRRRGIGRALLAAARAHAREKGARRLVLEVSVENRAALALYRSAGFSEVGRRRAYYPDGSDALILAVEPA